MTHAYYHAVSSQRLFGGSVNDYMAIHMWFDEGKYSFCDYRYRALRHHAEGIAQSELVHGVTIVNSDGKEVPTRLISEQHCFEDMGRIPNLADWLSLIKPEPWMAKATITRHLNRRSEL